MTEKLTSEGKENFARCPLYDTYPLTGYRIPSNVLIVNAIMFCDYEGHGFATDYAMSVESAEFYRVYYTIKTHKK